MKTFNSCYDKLAKIEYMCVFMVSLLTMISMSNIVLDTIILAIHIYSLYMIFKLDTGFLVKYFQFVLGSTWGIVAVFMMENLTVKVADHSSYHYGSFGLYVVSWQIFYLIIVLMERRSINKQIITDSKIKIENAEISSIKINTIRILVIIFTLVEIIAFLSICTKPYYLYSVDRVAYAQTVLPSWLRGHLGFFALILPFAVLILKDDKLLSCMYIGLYFLINLWSGEKFTGLFLGVYFIAVTYIGINYTNLNKKKIKKIIYIVAAVLSVFLIGVYFQMSVVGGRDFGYYFTERISAQGYIWWLTYANDSANGMHLNELAEELEPFISNLSGNLSDYNFGIYKLMKLYYETFRWENMLGYGLRGTESTRATFYYYAKIPGLVIGQALLAVLIFKILSKTTECIKKKEYVRILFSFYILRNFIAIYSMSDFYLLTKPTMIISYVMVIFGDRLNVLIKNRIPVIVFGRKKRWRYKR